MKMPKDIFATLEAAITAVVNHCGKDACNDYAEQYNNERLRWKLLSIAEHNLRYSNDHPGFAGGHWKRVYPQYAGWNLYNGLNDNHIDTALRAITKKLGV